jgi:hypothetical protein
MAENSIKEPPRILFYGSINPSEAEKVKSLFEIFITELLDQGFVLITREGCQNSETNDQVWLDNLVLDIAIPYRTKEKIDYSSVISYVSVDDHEPSSHDRKMLRLSGHGRLHLYRQLLSKCDAVVLVGGREGVYRISLFAHALKHLIIPFTIATGTAKEVATEIADEVPILPESISLVSSAINSISQADCRKAVSDIKSEIFRRRTAPPSNQIDNDLDGSISISELLKLVGKMKLSVFVALFTFILTIALGCFKLGVFVSGLEKPPTPSIEQKQITSSPNQNKNDATHK